MTSVAKHQVEKTPLHLGKEVTNQAIDGKLKANKLNNLISLSEDNPPKVGDWYFVEYQNKLYPGEIKKNWMILHKNTKQKQWKQRENTGSGLIKLILYFTQKINL